MKLSPKVGSAHMESSPIGIIFCVEPWNFPYYQLARVAGPHLMAGNVVMVKHAGIVPQCAIAFEKLWIDAGGPPGLYTNLLISHAQSDRIIDDERIKGVALTGSVAAGKSVAARAGANCKPSSMELGGSDAFIVLEDADLEHAIPWAVWGRMYTPGDFPVPLFDVVANCISIRGSFVGNREDMAETLTVADHGKVRADVELEPLASINGIFDRLKRGKIAGRAVLDFAPVRNGRTEIARQASLA